MSTATLLSAVMSAILMGTIGIFSKITGLPAESITFFRLMLGAVFMLMFLAATGKTELVRRWPSWPVLINGGFLAGFIIFYVQAMNYTTMANAIMLVYLAPLTASVIAHFFLGERLSPLAAGLIVLALFGFCMMMEFRVEFSGGSSESTGIFFGLLSLFAYAGFMLVNRVIAENIHVYTRTFYQLFTGAIVMLPLVLISGQQISFAQIPWLIGTGFFPGFLAILLAVIALSRLPAATFGTIAYFEPVAVMLFGWTIFQEALSPMQLAGSLLIIASSVIITLAGRQTAMAGDEL